MDKTLEFFTKAIPNVTEKNKSTQLGCHFEEIKEMLDHLSPKDAKANMILTLVKQAMTAMNVYSKETEGAFTILPNDREGFLDALCDQLVTIIGLGYMNNMDIKSAFDMVNDSNLSKFDDFGNPILDNNSKIVKGPNYFKPNLKAFV